MITQTINLNLIPGGVLPRINVSQYDKGSRTLNFNIYNGSVLFPIPSGSAITIQGTKPDHTAFQYSCEYEGSVVTADLEQQMSILAGEVVCEIAINKNTNLIGTGNFILCVEPAAVADDTVISETELPLIEQAIEAAAEAEASATAAAESAEEAASWSANPPYIGENGDWYIYDITTETFVDTGLPARGPQGETGQTGATGATPDITMTASVDSTTGTPSVTVTESGTAEEPTIALAFSGIKGETGATGAQGPQGETGPQGATGATGATGNGIADIQKTSTSGLVDTYTITYTNGDTDTFTVTNGRDGAGSGDMSASDYDSSSVVKNAGGIPDYVADQISGKQNMILASALPIGGTTETTVEGALGALNDVKQNIVLSSTMTIGGQTVTTVEGALSEVDPTLRDAEVIEGKNLFKMPYYHSYNRTAGGVTYTVASDGKIIANGTSTGQSWFYITVGKPLTSFDVDNYKINGVPSGANENICISVWDGISADSEKIYAGEDVTFTKTFLSSFADNANIAVGTPVAGTSFNNFVFEPMLRDANESPVYEHPYIPVKDAMLRRSEYAITGAVNLCPNNAVTVSKKGMTFTVNADGTVLTSNTPTEGNAAITIWEVTGEQIKKIVDANTPLKLLGCPVGGKGSKYHLKIYDKTNNWSTFAIDVGNGAVFDSAQFVDNHTYQVTITVNKDQTPPSQLWKPMITTNLSATYADYVPYAMTNKQLTNDKFYHIGDTIQVAGMICPGFLSSANTEIQFTMYLGKSLDLINGFDFSNIIMSIRKSAGGYIIQSENPTQNNNFTINNKTENRIVYSVRKNDLSIYDDVNNQPLSVSFTLSSGALICI